MDCISSSSPEGETGWALRVAWNRHERAVTAIHQYRVEKSETGGGDGQSYNRACSSTEQSDMVLITAIFYWWSVSEVELAGLGMMNGAAFAHGEWWSLFTATLLHADLEASGEQRGLRLYLPRLAMARYGPGTSLLAAYLAGVSGTCSRGSWEAPRS